MKQYSALNLLGKELDFNQPKFSLLSLIESWLGKQSTTVDLSIKIPHFVYVRTRILCDYVEEHVNTDLPIDVFLSTLYDDFVHRYMKRHDLQKMYEEITKYSEVLDKLEINDSKANKIYLIKKKDHTPYTFGFKFNKENIKRGEMFLSELDEMNGYYFSVEQLIQRLWINFIRTYSDGNNVKAVEKLFKLLKHTQALQ